MTALHELSIDELQARFDDLTEDLDRTQTEILGLVRLNHPTDGQAERLVRLEQHAAKVNTDLGHTTAHLRKRRIDHVRAVAANSANRTSGDGACRPEREADDGPELWRQRDSDPWRAPIISGDFYAEVRGRAFDAIERSGRHLPVSDDSKQVATRIVESAEDDLAARWAITASDPHYLRAFAKVLADPSAGANTWTELEREAFARARVVQRAMSLTDAAGGYMVPFALDPALILTGTGTTNAFRQAARVEQTIADTWNGVSTAGITMSWDGEAAEVSDDSPTLAQPSITVHKAQGFVPFSIEVSMDAVRLVEELGRAIADARDTLEGTAFATGSGSSQPFGIVTALTGTGSVVASATTDTFAVGDVYNLIEQLPARYQANARWMANLSIVNDMRQFATGSGPQHAFVADLTAGSPPTVLGKPIHECSDLDGTINATADNYVLVVGDWRHYVIVDRVGMNVELVPHLMGANRRPTGQRGLYCYFRTGADSVADGAFRVLNVT